MIEHVRGDPSKEIQSTASALHPLASRHPREPDEAAPTSGCRPSTGTTVVKHLDFEPPSADALGFGGEAVEMLRRVFSDPLRALAPLPNEEGSAIRRIRTPLRSELCARCLSRGGGRWSVAQLAALGTASLRRRASYEMSPWMACERAQKVSAPRVGQLRSHRPRQSAVSPDRGTSMLTSPVSFVLFSC